MAEQTPQTQAKIDPNRINAAPSKEFFIHMLTRDVQLTRSIIDLLDNSVDGAKRLRGKESFHGLWVMIEVSPDHFKISDNCGGIPVKVAREYAFCFGRPKGAEDTPNSLGLFGVGMKRTFFKLGNKFEVKSRCLTEEFDVNVDVRKWVEEGEADPGDWHFEFSQLKTGIERGEDVGNLGTQIIVTELHEAIAAEFGLDTLVNQLAAEISAAHILSIQNGLAITVNTLPVQFTQSNLFTSDALQPAVMNIDIPRARIDDGEGEGVKVKLLAGLAKRDFQDGGWYVFCNGRLILKADKTAASVWGRQHSVNQYHGDFAYFRGYAFFESANSVLLPWTTTKTGVDTDSAVYKAVQKDMIEMTKPIIAFLRRIAGDQADGNIEEGALDVELTKAVATGIQTLSAPSTFRANFTTTPATGPRFGRIQYSRPLDQINRAKKMMEVNSFKEVGEISFDYYLEFEGGK
jgi:Histidine kinase-, DNA gyrase B-, and HSP90-like ATPase